MTVAASEAGLAVPARLIPWPRSLSAAARQALQDFYGATPSAWPDEDDLPGWRERIAQVDGFMAVVAEAHLAAGGSFERAEMGGVPVAVAPGLAALSGDKRVLLDIHGGALISGGGDFVSAAAVLSTRLHGVPTVSIDYRMPPDHPFPAGLEDCVAVYDGLLRDRSPQDIVVSGGSAGGNLAASMLLLARSRGLPMPGGLILLSPEVDLTESGDSFETLAGIDPMLSRLGAVNRLYAAGAALDDPLLSPLFGDLRGFPPTLLQAGTRDLFLSNTARMHRALRTAGVDAELHVFEAMPHAGFQGAPEDDDLSVEIQKFVKKVFGGI